MEFSCSGWVGTEFGSNFFFSFSAYLILFWLKIMPESGFLIFWIFILFFSEFSCLGRVWTELGSKIFFFLFLGLSNPVLAKTNAEKRFLKFFEFFCYFFRNFLARVEYERNSGLNFFSLFLSLSHPGLDGHNARTMFFKLLNFFAFFLEFSSSGRVRMKFGTIIFFFLSRPISSGFV